MGRYLVFLLFAGFIFSSCVQNKQILYLQSEDELDTDFPTDTVLRTYTYHFEEYRIQKEDVLHIKFESVSSNDFNFIPQVANEQNNAAANQAFLAFNGILVDNEGFIQYPVLGSINIEGLTLKEAEAKIQQIARQYVVDVIVRVRMLNFRFTILGEVKNEQTAVSYNTRLTLFEAIGLTGGFTDLADRSEVKVIRQYGDKTRVFYVNLLQEDFVDSDYFFVKQNDIIIVPPLKQRPFRTYVRENLTLVTSTLSTILLIVTLLNQ